MLTDHCKLIANSSNSLKHTFKSYSGGINDTINSITTPNIPNFLNTWHHFTCTTEYNGFVTYGKIYIDGIHFYENKYILQQLLQIWNADICLLDHLMVTL